MRTVFSIVALSVFGLFFSQKHQVEVSSKKNQVENLYQGGQQKFDEDLQNNLRYTATNFQASGDFQLTFTVTENGKIEDVKLLPELFDTSFEREIKRDLSRMGKYFAAHQTQDVSVALSFSREQKISDGRFAFMDRSAQSSNRPN